eukprot:358844-Chlamydomonas_euryale.AAC.2
MPQQQKPCSGVAQHVPHPAQIPATDPTSILTFAIVYYHVTRLPYPASIHLPPTTDADARPVPHLQPFNFGKEYQHRGMNIPSLFKWPVRSAEHLEDSKKGGQIEFLQPHSSVVTVVAPEPIPPMKVPHQSSDSASQI